MTERTATCGCGKLTVVCRGEPTRISVCHCNACKRRTGSAFGVQARFPDSALAIAGKAKTFKRTGDRGSEVTFHFCPDCGSTVYWRLSANPGYASVAVGCFADPAFPPPRVAIYDELRCPWACIDSGAPMKHE